VEQLINDLIEFDNERKGHPTKSYYLGNIVVKPRKNKITDAVEQEVLVDGQQRLTTLMLFLKHLKNSLKNIKNIDNNERKSFEKNINDFLYSSFEDRKLKIQNAESDLVLNKIMNDQIVKGSEEAKSKY
jgi:uncharacterized protein with ParB-like and HNH nuclease domain